MAGGFRAAGKKVWSDTLKWFGELPAFLSKKNAEIWVAAYNAGQRVEEGSAKIVAPLFGGAVIVMGLIAIASAQTFQSWLLPFYVDERGLPNGHFQNLRALAQALGGAMIGVAGIAFTLVMFSIQTNVERMPHGLFRKFGADARLLLTFLLVFLLAAMLAILSLVQDTAWLGASVLAGAWSLIALVTLLWYAYDRALTLVNPAAQLKIIRKVATKEFVKWSDRATRLRPLYSHPEDDNSQVDWPLLRFQTSHRFWTRIPLEQVAYAVSFSRRASDRHDYEVASSALDAIVAINTDYVGAKGRTFFSPPIIGDDPHSADEFINRSLESIRQELRVATTQGDELYISLLLRALSALTQRYARIPYPGLGSVKHHAQLSAAYLSDAVQALVPHGMVDRVMEGLSQMGANAVLLVREGGPTEATTLASKIAGISLAGAIRPDQRPITLEGVQQLSNITLALLVSPHDDTDYAFSTLRDQITFVAQSFLNIPDAPIERTHSTFLGPYFSSVDKASFTSRLITLANAAINGDPEDKSVKQFAYQLERFADGMARAFQGLLQKAIERESSFAQDLIFFICRVTNTLAATSKWVEADGHLERDLQEHAWRLLLSTTWVPDDEKSLLIISAYDFEGNLFEAGADAWSRDRTRICEGAIEAILSLGFKYAMYWKSSDHAARSFLAAAMLALTSGPEERTKFIAAFKRHLDRSPPPNEAVDRLRKEMAKYADPRTRGESRYRPIEVEFDGYEDREGLAALMKQVLELLPRANDEGGV